MSQYSYSSLPSGSHSIRLLRLMPQKDKTAAIQCELFEYSLQNSCGTHLYEALSYVWGNPDKKLPICMHNYRFDVTINLHAALSRLRNHSMERVIWIDALCINQSNQKEKEQQIQYMARIYSQANRVIVWLGEAEDKSDQALEAIHVAPSKKSSEYLENGTVLRAVLALLQRSWFRRIWIIQEVAAARHVLIMCGPTEIDGYAFCLGLELFKDVYESLPGLQGLIYSVTYLIKGTIFRRKYTSTPGRVSLDICPLGELMDMYHTHEATKRHDKVYALLGMSSDDLSKANLLPNYEVPWKELLQRLVKFLLCKEISVETWDDREMAIIKSKGSVIGLVSSIEKNWDDRQNVCIISKNTSEHPGYNKEWNTSWTLQASAKPIRKGDLVCLLQGASNPTIIRPRKDYFVIIIIAATPPKAVGTESSSVGPPGISQLITYFPHNFLLTWDWEQSQEEACNQEDYKTLLEALGQLQEHPKLELEDNLDTTTRLWNAALILEDSEEYEMAKERLQGAVEGYERAFGKGNSHTLTAMETLALVYKKTEQWEEGEQLLLQVIQTKQTMQGADNPDTLSSMASLMLAYQDQQQLIKAEKLEMMIHLLELRGAPMTEKVVLQVARSLDEEVLELLLKRKEEEIQITEEIVKAAAGNQRSGQEAMTLLLNRKGDKIQITEGALVQIATHFNRDVMTLLLNKKGDQIQISEEVVKAVAGNERSGQDIITLLLDRRDDIQITEEVAKVAIGNEESGEEILMLLLDRKEDEIQDKVQITEGAVVEIIRWGNYQTMEFLFDRKGGKIKITEEVVKAVIRNRAGGKEMITNLLNRKGEEIQITEEIVKATAESSWSGTEAILRLLNQERDKIQITEGVVVEIARRLRREVMELLLDRKGDTIQITEEVVKAAASNEGNGLEVLDLLLDRKGDQIQITEEVVKAAAGNSFGGQEVMELLLDRKGDQIQITEEVVKAAAGNWKSGHKVMGLLFDREGDQIQDTEEVVKAAAGNLFGGQEVLELLLDRKGDQIQITEEVVKAVAGNWKSGHKVMRLLLDRKGDQIRVTEEVVKAAVGNRRRGQKLMELLLYRKGDQIQITEEVLKQVAGNGVSGKEVMKLLLDQKGDQVQITEEVVKAAAGNKRIGYAVMRLLLDQKGEEIPITEEVVKAAAGNEWSGRAVMQLLLDRKGDQIQITEEVLKAVAGNKEGGQEVMTLLRNKRGDNALVAKWDVSYP